MPPVALFLNIINDKTKAMIKIYGTGSCPDCAYVEAQVEGNGRYEVIDVCANVRNLKAFLRLRDSNSAFDAVKRRGTIGIPCFILGDGTVTLKADKAGLHPSPKNIEGPSCRIDGSGC